MNRDSCFLGQMVVSGCGGVEENEICLLTCCRTVAYGGGSLMVWGGISLNNKTDLIFILPFAHEIGPDFVSMQDGARAHISRVTTRFLEDSGIQVMDWPPRSPDLSCIEHLWDLIGRRLHNRHFRNWKMHCWKNGGSFLKKPSAGLSEACHGGVKQSSMPEVVTHVIERPFSLSLALFFS